MNVSNNYIKPNSPYFKTLDNFFNTSPDNSGYLLDESPPQKQISKDEIIKELSYCNNLKALTATMDLKKCGYMTLQQKFQLLENTLNHYIEHNAECGAYTYATIELTAAFTPHAHIITNGFICNFKTYFSPLGLNNTKKGAIQELRNFDGWIKYLDKEDPPLVDHLNIRKPYYWSAPKKRNAKKRQRLSTDKKKI